MTNSSSMHKQYWGAKPGGTATTLYKQHWFTNNKEFLETAAWVTSKVLFTLVKLLRKSLQKAEHFCTTKLFRKEEVIHLKGSVQETTAAAPVKQQSYNNTEGDTKLERVICPLSHDERALLPTQVQKAVSVCVSLNCWRADTSPLAVHSNSSRVKTS